MYGTGAEVVALNEMIADLGVQSIVTYHGALKQNELASRYGAMDAFIFPTHRESFGLVAVEALACGTPVLASDIRPVNEVVKNNVNGLLFAVRDEYSIARTIIEILTMDTERYEQLCEATRDSVALYASDRVIKELDENLIRRAIFGKHK